MAANVFRVIIPSQKNMVNAALNNKLPDLNQGISAKTRSIHNNYITLPVLFIMISEEAIPIKKIPPVINKNKGSLILGLMINQDINAARLPHVSGAIGNLPT